MRKAIVLSVVGIFLGVGIANADFNVEIRTDKLVYFESDAESEQDWQGRLAQVRITWAGPWSLIGEVVP